MAEPRFEHYNYHLPIQPPPGLSRETRQFGHPPTQSRVHVVGARPQTSFTQKLNQAVEDRSQATFSRPHAAAGKKERERPAQPLPKPTRAPPQPPSFGQTPKPHYPPARPPLEIKEAVAEGPIDLPVFKLKNPIIDAQGKSKTPAEGEKGTPNRALRNLIEELQNKQLDEINIEDLKSITCPLSFLTFNDPVTILETGNTYERADLTDALNRHPMRDPLTNSDLSTLTLVENEALKAAINDLKDAVKPKLHNLDLLMHRIVNEFDLKQFNSHYNRLKDINTALSLFEQYPDQDVEGTVKELIPPAVGALEDLLMHHFNGKMDPAAFLKSLNFATGLLLEAKEPLKSQLAATLDTVVATANLMEIRYLEANKILSLTQTICQIQRYLESNGGLDTEGLFRLSGSEAVLSSFLKSHNLEMELITLEAIKNEIPHPRDIATYVKRVIRTMEAPIIPYGHANMFENLPLSAVNYTKTVHTLPPINYQALKSLMRFLQTVQAHSSENKMNAANLGVVWGPSLFPGVDISNIVKCNQAVKFMIENYQEIFEREDSPKLV